MGDYSEETWLEFGFWQQLKKVNTKRRKFFSRFICPNLTWDYQGRIGLFNTSFEMMAIIREATLTESLSLFISLHYSAMESCNWPLLKHSIIYFNTFLLFFYHLLKMLLYFLKQYFRVLIPFLAKVKIMIILPFCNTTQN